ncbi:MAG: hypothetical protein GEU90_00035 [Gemmatimonas sp.]|nr:hypothetical protein [Gemmatimonas sp.]
MQPTTQIHIGAGAAAIVLGFVALFAAKGARLHRTSGRFFVFAMVVMGLSAAVMAALAGIQTSIASGLLVTYLVITALTTVRSPTPGVRWLEIGGMFVALLVGVGYFVLAARTLAEGEFVRDGAPVPILFLFGTVALSASAGDFRVLRSGGIRGKLRVARHLWRMCFALFITSASFFLGQVDEIPEALRIPPLLAIPALLPLPLMFYWLHRVRRRGVVPSPVAARPAEAV